jgi:putative FmdB family regulatory protein
MPTYEYLCQKCGKTFEMFQSMKDAPLKICTCGKKGKVRRLVGRGAGIIFKGSGFYETDYRRRHAKTEGAAAAAKSASGAAAAAKSASGAAASGTSSPAPSPPSSASPKK